MQESLLHFAISISFYKRAAFIHTKNGETDITPAQVEAAFLLRLKDAPKGLEKRYRDMLRLTELREWALFERALPADAHLEATGEIEM